jgi:hypothetical protein
VSSYFAAPVLARIVATFVSLTALPASAVYVSGSPTLLSTAELASNSKRRLLRNLDNGARALPGSGAGVRVPLAITAKDVASLAGSASSDPALLVASTSLYISSIQATLTARLKGDAVVSAALGSNFDVTRDLSFVASYKAPPQSTSTPASGAPLDYALIIGLGAGLPVGLIILCILFYLVRAASPNLDLERYKRDGPHPALFAGKPTPHPVTMVGGIGRGRQRDASAFTSTNPMQMQIRKREQGTRRDV